MTPNICPVCRDLDEPCPDHPAPAVGYVAAPDPPGYQRPTVTFTSTATYVPGVSTRTAMENARALIDMAAPLTGTTWDELRPSTAPTEGTTTAPRHPLMRPPWPDARPAGGLAEALAHIAELRAELRDLRARVASLEDRARASGEP